MNQERKTMKKMIRALTSWVLFVAASVAWAWQRFIARENVELLANAQVNVTGTHDGAKTVKLDGTVTVRHLLYKLGTDDNHVAVCAATADAPLGTIADEGVAEDEVALLILGKGPTKRFVASEAIAVGDALFTTTTGKVQNFPGAGAATYWQVGIALTAAAADGDVVEASDCVPVKLVVAS